ncbi:MAG: hypothetical protein JO001_16075 [Alphaproteobacteria bacterium]|nr:hypothetical protein [Alphaproteobacteria bacterium]
MTPASRVDQMIDQLVATQARLDAVRKMTAGLTDYRSVVGDNRPRASWSDIETIISFLDGQAVQLTRCIAREIGCHV